MTENMISAEEVAESFRRVKEADMILSILYDEPKTQLDALNQFLVKVALAKAGIRRKIVVIKRFITKLMGL